MPFEAKSSRRMCASSLALSFESEPESELYSLSERASSSAFAELDAEEAASVGSTCAESSLKISLLSALPSLGTSSWNSSLMCLEWKKRLCLGSCLVAISLHTGLSNTGMKLASAHLCGTYLENLVGQILLVDLAMKDLLLHRAGHDQAIDRDGSRLADTPRSMACLHIGAGIPVRIVQEHTVGPREVDTEAADTRRQEEQKDGFASRGVIVVGVVVVLVDELLALRERRLTVHAQIRVALLLAKVLDNVEHHGGLREPQCAMALLVPEAHELLSHLHLARALPMAIVIRQLRVVLE